MEDAAAVVPAEAAGEAGQGGGAPAQQRVEPAVAQARRNAREAAKDEEDMGRGA